ncbi:hypothetical protein ACFPJ4_13895 [Lysinimonas soli]|uniref:DUF4175 domain-containing protein n=1 Tax=Lysinimonas soli TaxID=1074233 RepID=A0ABW0NTR1_9MICO
MKLDPRKMRLLAPGLFLIAVFESGFGIWDLIVADTFSWVLVLLAVIFAGAGVGLLIAAKSLERRR